MESRKNILVLLLLAVFVLLMLFVGYKVDYLKKFNPDRLVENSIFKNKTFETNVIEMVSDKGIKAYLFEDKTNPIVSINFLFKDIGIAYDENGKFGISNMVSSMLTQGAGEFDNSSIKEEMELNAIGISFGVDYDDFSGSLLTTKENKDKAYNLLNLMLTKPRFDKEELELAKQRYMFALRSQKEQPGSILSLAFLEEVYKEHPYARNPIGKEEDIKALSKEDLLDFVKKKISQDRIVVSVSGDVSADEAKEALDIIFAGIAEKSDNIEIDKVNTDFTNREKHIEHLSAQNVATFAADGVDRNNPDFYPLYIANYIFGDQGLSSRLAIKARENEGLTYGIYSYLSLSPKSNLIRGGFSSTPDNYNRVIDILNEEWKKMRELGVTEEEFIVAKKYLVSSYNLRFASIDGISSILTSMQRYNLGIDFLKKRNEYVNNVTLDEVNAAAKKYFRDDLVIMSIGKFNKNGSE